MLQAGPRATAPTPSSCPCPNLPRRGTTLPPVPCEEGDRGERGAGGAKASRPGKPVATIRLLDHSPKGTRRCASSLLLLLLLRKVVVAFVVWVWLPGSVVLAPPSQRALRSQFRCRNPVLGEEKGHTEGAGSRRRRMCGNVRSRFPKCEFQKNVKNEKRAKPQVREEGDRGQVKRPPQTRRGAELSRAWPR